MTVNASDSENINDSDNVKDNDNVNNSDKTIKAKICTNFQVKPRVFYSISFAVIVRRMPLISSLRLLYSN